MFVRSFPTFSRRLQYIVVVLRLRGSLAHSPRTRRYVIFHFSCTLELTLPGLEVLSYIFRATLLQTFPSELAVNPGRVTLFFKVADFPTYVLQTFLVASVQFINTVTKSPR